jgi:DNA-3-methyladenine glycosylase
MEIHLFVSRLNVATSFSKHEKMSIPSVEYFRQEDTLQLAKDLIGMILLTRFDGVETSGRIAETEAYLGETDRASHAFGGRRTRRTETMYLPGGHAYVYLCYGLHNLFNIVTHQKDIPHAILIRALEPLTGIEYMLERRNKAKVDFSLTRGPGSLSQAMGIQTMHSGMPLQTANIIIANNRNLAENEIIETSPRIGVNYAGTDALLPYRFSLKGNPWVSGPKIKNAGS